MGIEQPEERRTGGVRADLQKVQDQYAELERAAAAHSAEAERLRGENLELRNEVHQLRDEVQQLRKEAQAQAAQASLASAQVQQQEQVQAERQRVLALDQQALGQSAQRDACIENLRHIDEAKQKWGQKQFSSFVLSGKILSASQRETAVEHGRVGLLIPTTQDIEVYFSGAVLPRCPAGGTYILNAVKEAPNLFDPWPCAPAVSGGASRRRRISARRIVSNDPKLRLTSASSNSTTYCGPRPTSSRIASASDFLCLIFEIRSSKRQLDFVFGTA